MVMGTPSGVKVSAKRSKGCGEYSLDARVKQKPCTLMLNSSSRWSVAPLGSGPQWLSRAKLPLLSATFGVILMQHMPQTEKERETDCGRTSKGMLTEQIGISN